MMDPGPFPPLPTMPWRGRAAAALAILVGLAGCGPSVLDGDANSVWIQEPVISFGSPTAAAEEHCARFGKTAVYSGRMVGNQGDWRNKTTRANFTPIDVFDCR